jgi:hypothetical protein
VVAEDGLKRTEDKRATSEWEERSGGLVPAGSSLCVAGPWGTRRSCAPHRAPVAHVAVT